MYQLKQIATILEKIYYKIALKWIPAYTGMTHHNESSYSATQPSSEKKQRLVLYLNYPKFIHFGDTLWFEPIARLLIANGYDVVIYANPAMEFYFKALGYTIIHDTDISSSNDILITRTELAWHLRGKKVIWIDFNYTKIKMPLLNHVLHTLEQKLNLPLTVEEHAAIPQAVEFSHTEKAVLLQKLQLSETQKYVIFNNYMDSHKFGMPKALLYDAIDQLSAFVVHKFKSSSATIADGIKIIHTGTQREKEADHHRYQFIDLDLRGALTIREIFILATLDNVVAYIGFDTLWLHVFNLYSKTSYVRLKPGFSDDYNTQIKKYVAIPFTTAANCPHVKIFSNLD